MKFSLAFLIALALSGAVNINASPVRSSSELHDVLDEFLALLPIDKIKEIAIDYLKHDPEVQKAIEYLQSPEFRQIVEEVEDMKEARDVLAYLQESGLDAYGFLNKIHELLEIPPFKPSYLLRSHVSRATGGLAGLIADIKAILPIDDIKALYHEKLENSPAFADLIKRLSAPEFQEFVNAVLAKEEARVIINKLKSHGVDVQAIADLLSTILGLEFPKPSPRSANYNLSDDLKDFLALLPIDKIKEIAMDYLEHDPEVQKTIEYLESPEFRQIVEEVEDMKEARDVLAYLQESGLDAYGFLNKIHELLEIPPFKPSYLLRSHVSRASGGLVGLITDIKAILPIDDIKALYHEKLENSPAFADLIKRLSAPEFQEFVDAVLAKEEARVIINKLKSHGVDLQAIADLLSAILGLKFPNSDSRSTLFYVESVDKLLSQLPSARSAINDDLQEFVNLLPVNKIRMIVMKHYLFDKEFKRAVAYIRSEEFYKLIRKLHEIPEYNELLKSFEEAGIEVDTSIKAIHEMIGFPNNLAAYHPNMGRSITSFIDEVMAILPLDDIKALYQKKLETSKDFVHFVELISSKKFQAITDALFADETFRNIIHKLQDYKVNIQAISDFFLAVFGITTPPGIIH